MVVILDPELMVMMAMVIMFNPEVVVVMAMVIMCKPWNGRHDGRGDHSRI